MPIGGCKETTNPNSGKDAAKPVSGAVEECPKGPCDETRTEFNNIYIFFDPAKSSKVIKCDRIVHIQFLRTYADGEVIKRGDWNSINAFLDEITTEDGWCVDCFAKDKTPDYQQDAGGDGKKNGGSVKAFIEDGPVTAGGNKGFYHYLNNKEGWKEYRAEFATFAWCMKGEDCGKWYEGVLWEYVKTWEDSASYESKTRQGVARVINKNYTQGPSESHLKAFELFNKKRGFTPCK